MENCQKKINKIRFFPTYIQLIPSKHNEVWRDPLQISCAHVTVADLRGGARDARPPTAQNFFIFMQFSGKIDQIIGWHTPPLGLAPPPLRNPGSATV